MSDSIFNVAVWMVRPTVVARDVAAVGRDLKELRIERERTNLDAIGDFERLGTLEIFDVDDAAVAAISRVRTLHALALHRVKAKSLEPLTELRGLEVLIIEAATAITDIDFCAYFARLTHLSLSFLPRVKSIAAVGSLQKLRMLRLEMNDDATPRRRWGVDSLAPLAGCAQLRWLRVMIDVDDGSLAGLRRLPLTHVHLRVGFSVEELGAFAGAHPQLANSVSVLTRFDAGVCVDCGRSTVLPRTGGRALCRRCDAAKIEALQDRWHKARGAGA